MKRTMAIVLAILLSLTYTTCAFASELKKGSKGNGVKQVQERLIELGFLDGKADGDFGRKTEKAVQDYQTSVGLEATGVVDDKTINSLNAVKENSENASTEESNDESLSTVVYDTYMELSNLTIDDLEIQDDIIGKKYVYKSHYSLVPEDVDWIENPRNTKGTVEDGAIYRKIAYILAGFDLGLTSGNGISEDILGFQTNSRQEFAPYVKKLVKFITIEDSMTAVMKQFSKLKTVKGTFNFKKRKYDFEIKDLSACAAELGISEKMLGCIFAMLNEYAPEIVMQAYPEAEAMQRMP